MDDPMLPPDEPDVILPPASMYGTQAEVEAMQHAPPPTPEETDGLLVVLILGVAAWLLRPKWNG